MSDFPAGVQRIIKARSGGTCEGCGLTDATEIHHCQFRSRLGPSVAGNALHLCGWGNHTGCHGIAHSGAKAEAIGWAIRSRHDPLIVPKRISLEGRKTWVRFDNDGGLEVIPEADALEYLYLIGARRGA